MRQVHIWLLSVLFAVCATAAGAVDRGSVDKAFAAWLKNDLWPEAKAAGVSEETFSRATAGLTLDWDMPEIAPPGTKPEMHVQHQAEFRAPAAYFNEGSIAGLAGQARTKAS